MISIKEKYKKKVVGYNGSTTPLGERNDINILAEIALSSNDPSLLELFEQIPTLEELRNKKGEKLISELKKKQ